MTTLDGIFLEALLRRVVREELAKHHPAGDRASDARLEAFLRLCWEFSGAGAWTCSEILTDARRAGDRALLGSIDAIVGDATDPAKALGRFLQRHDGGEADGLRLVRIKREAGSWLYAVESGES